MAAPKKDQVQVVCAYCTGEINKDFGPKCPVCKSFHHANCWAEFGGCTTFGCKESPDMKKFQQGSAN